MTGHLSATQRAMVAEKIALTATDYAPAGGKQPPRTPIGGAEKVTMAEAAKLLNVGTGLIDPARTVRQLTALGA